MSGFVVVRHTCQLDVGQICNLPVSSGNADTGRLQTYPTTGESQS